MTATIETKLTQQGDLAVEEESLKNDVADTHRSLAADQELDAKLAESRSSQSSEWEERATVSRRGAGRGCASATIDSSFLILWVLPRGRSQLVESFVWLVPLVRIESCFSIIYMIRIRFFGSGELNQKGFSVSSLVRFVS